MFIVEAIPIQRGVNKDSLSYFSSKFVSVGSLVKVPLRAKFAWGVILSCVPANIQKAELKSSSFSLKKISTSNDEYFFEKWWIDATKKISQYFALSQGSIIACLAPSQIIENIEKTLKLFSKRARKERIRSETNKKNIKSEILCMQTDDMERWGFYKSAIREEFAKSHSVFICLPTHEDIRTLLSQFEKGIEKYTFFFHSGLNKNELLKKWNDCLKEEHPVLIIATAPWLIIPRSDIGTIILDKEGGAGWKTLSRPYIDMRKAVEFFAKEKGIRLILGDSCLRIETIWRLKSDEVFAYEPVKFRLSSGAKTMLVSMKGVVPQGNKEAKDFRVISAELRNLIEISKSENKNIFIYATRKGLSSITVCKDCGEEVVCHNCASPMVLYKAPKGNIFRCHQCGSTRSAKEFCKRCNSWRLLPLGIGIERVVEEIQKFVPNTNILEISRDSTNAKQAAQIAERFYKGTGQVLVGTEMALYYLKNPVDFTAVASIDSLFSVPDFKIREKIFHLILTIKLLAREKCLVQTRSVEKGTIELSLSGNLLDFYKTEIEDREILQYPPFSIFIKVTIRGYKALVEKESKFLEEFFNKWEPIIFPSSSERRGEVAATNCVIKIKRSDWFDSLSNNNPDMELFNKLLSLPYNFEIKIDPDNLL